jgi:predicted AAA+ superfamily ATPase
VELPKEIRHPLPFFKEYMKKGYYPFFRQDDYLLRLDNVINQTLEVDIPTFANMNISTARKLKKLIYVISKNVPFKPNLSKIGRTIESDRGQVADYLVYMEKAGLIRQLKNTDMGMKSFEKTEKIYLSNTNLIYSQADSTPDIGNLRETAFFSSLAVANTVAASPVSDFLVGKHTFEVGGKNKNGKQIKDIPDAYIVKDDIEYGYSHTLPLWSFGLNY